MAVPETELISAHIETELPADSLMSKIEVVGSLEGGLIEAYVPMDLVYGEDVPVNEPHVRELAQAITRESLLNGGSGQLSPILVAEIPEFGKFVTIDGFHRVPALKSLGRTEVFATVRPNSTWEEAIDLRILAATTHKSVQFARVVEWVEEAWRRTPWSDRMDATQALRMYATNSTGIILGMKREEAVAVKEWVANKCNQWHLSSSVVLNSLSIAKIADPELVKEARASRSGRTLEYLTPQHLQVIAKGMPNQYDKQRLIAGITKLNVLTVPKTRALVALISKDPDMDVKKAKEIVKSIDMRTLEPLYSPSRRRELERQDCGDGASASIEFTWDSDILDQLFDAEIELGSLAIRNALLSGKLDKGQANSALAELNAESKRTFTDKFKEMLPRLESPERRIAVLRAFFKLSDKAVGEVLVVELNASHSPIPKPNSTLSSQPNVGGDTGGNEVSPSDTPASLKSQETFKTRKFGPVLFADKEYQKPRKTEAVLRVRNLDDINKLTLEVSKKFKITPNRLVIERYGRPVMNEGVTFIGPLEMEVLNTLLASYLCKPYSLSEAHSQYGFSSELRDSELEYKLVSLHRLAVGLYHHGLIFYNPQNKDNFGLKPTLIRDKRSSGSSNL